MGKVGIKNDLGEVVAWADPEQSYPPEFRSDLAGIYYWLRPKFTLSFDSSSLERMVFLTLVSNNTRGALLVSPGGRGEARKFSVHYGLNKLAISLPASCSQLYFTLTPEVKITGDLRSLGACIGQIDVRSIATEYDGSYFFLHIPKCAGTSINDYFHNAIGPQNCLPHVEYELRNNGAYSDDQLLQYKYISGHFDTSMLVRLGFVHRAFTVLRNPIDRVTSQYHYNRAQPINSLAKFICTNNSLTELMKKENRVLAEEAMLVDQATKMLSGGLSESVREYEGISDETLLSNSQAMLDAFSLVGFVENIEEFISTLSEKVGIPLAAPLQRLNTGNYEIVDEGTRSCIAEANELDCALYEWAINKYKARYLLR